MIRDHPRFKRTAIIFVSAVMTTNPDQLRGYQLGGVDDASVPSRTRAGCGRSEGVLGPVPEDTSAGAVHAERPNNVSPNEPVELKRFNEETRNADRGRTREREAVLAQLFEAQKMDVIGQLTGGVAHHFNGFADGDHG